MHSNAKILDACCKASPPMLWLSLLQGSIGFAPVQWRCERFENISEARNYSSESFHLRDL